MDFYVVLSAVTAHIEEHGLGSLEGEYRLELGEQVYTLCGKDGGGHQLVEGIPTGPRCSFTMSKASFVKLIDSPGTATMLFMQGKIKIDRLPEALKFVKALQGSLSKAPLNV